MVTTLAAGPGHPVVATLLGLGAAALAALVVAMAWSVHVHQIRLAEQLTRRQFTVTGEADQAEAAALPVTRPDEVARAGNGGNGGNGKAPPPVVIDGPETVVTGEQARYRLRPAGIATMVSWAVGGGSVSQSPDPSHPDELLVIADRPGDLTVIARAREGMVERRATKAVTALPEVAAPAPPFALRLFLHSWGLVAVVVLVIGFAGALLALGSLNSTDFIALVVPVAAVLGMTAVSRGGADTPPRPGQAGDTARPPR